MLNFLTPSELGKLANPSKGTLKFKENNLLIAKSDYKKYIQYLACASDKLQKQSFFFFGETTKYSPEVVDVLVSLFVSMVLRMCA